MKRNYFLIISILLLFLNGCGDRQNDKEIGNSRGTQKEDVEKRSVSELYMDNKKELNHGVQEFFYYNGELIGENRAVVKKGEEADWKYYSIKDNTIQELKEEQENTYKKTITKKALFQSDRDISFDLDCELTLNQESNEIVSYSSIEGDGMASSVLGVYDAHTLWVGASGERPGAFGFYCVLYDFGSNKVLDVLEGLIPEGTKAREVHISPNGKSLLLRLYEGDGPDEIIYVNGMTNEKKKISEIVDTQDKKFIISTFLEDSRVFVTQTRNSGKSQPLEQGFVWNVETNEVKQLYGEEETVILNTEEREATRGLGICIIAESTNKYRVVSADKRFSLEDVSFYKSGYEFFPTKNMVGVLKTEQNEERQTVIKELGFIDMEQKEYVLVDDAAVLRKAYKDVKLNDENSIGINVKDGFYLYCLNR